MLGAIQVPPNGEPVIFLNDHPVTGGYPVIGVVESVDVRPVTSGGLRTVEVVIRARLPLVGLLGPSGLAVTGHALDEP